jgi:hypothetical protein
MRKKKIVFQTLEEAQQTAFDKITKAGVFADISKATRSRLKRALVADYEALTAKLLDLRDDTESRESERLREQQLLNTANAELARVRETVAILERHNKQLQTKIDGLLKNQKVVRTKAKTEYGETELELVINPNVFRRTRERLKKAVPSLKGKELETIALLVYKNSAEVVAEFTETAMNNITRRLLNPRVVEPLAENGADPGLKPRRGIPLASRSKDSESPSKSRSRPGRR